MKLLIYFGVTVILVLSFSQLSVFLAKSDTNPAYQTSRLLRDARPGQEIFLDQMGIHDDVGDVCITFPRIFDKRKRVANEFGNRLAWTIKAINYVDRDMPQIKALTDGANFAIWNTGGINYSASAWKEVDGKILFIEGPGWDYPRSDANHTLEVEGDFVGFSSPFPNEFGHIIPDQLPVIAWLLTKVPSKTKFILHYDPNKPLAQHIMKVVDKSFYDRVLWIPYDTVVNVKRGILKVLVADKLPLVMGTKLMNPLREWLIASHPEANDHIDTNHPNGLVVFYSRAGTSDVKHGRILQPDHEMDIIDRIKQAMVRFGRREEFVVYNGMNPDGTHMSVEDQFKLFRRAKSIIGPHGSGLANMVWLNFEHAGSSCSERPKVLEFVSGPDSEQVQHEGGRYNGYNLIFRAMPIEYSNILYTKESSKDFTFVDVEALELALHAMWATVSEEVD